MWGESLFGFPAGDPDGRSDLDSAPSMLRSLVADSSFPWGADRPPGTPYRDTVIYELHVKGLTQARRDVPPALRGTYAGLACPPVVEYLAGLGVTAVELLPVHQSVASMHLAERGLTDYWGYNTIGFFAPHDGYSAAVRAGRGGGQIAEFQAMVQALHAAGLEVLLDVVFNHTAEGSHLGPTLCFRGLDNPGYYRLVAGDRRRYVDTTGTGNSINADHPTCLRLIMDSLRYWVGEMHVDGFRFDLATTLARERGNFDRLAAFFDIVAQDPVISRIKLIAEPWDVGQVDSYSVGRFPVLWREWNGRYRDTVRDFWRGSDWVLPDLATRLAGSSDLYGATRHRPTASVNFITAHDGFTLRDLVSYNRKHNEANGEGNRDGTDDNRSWNCGVEGPTADPEILALRARQSRALLGTLLLSRGVPMILGGDETWPHPGRQQQRLLPGQSDVLVRLGRRRRGPDRLHPPDDRVPPRAPGAAPWPLPGRSRLRRLVHPSGPGDDRRRLALPGQQVPRHLCRRHGRAGPRRTRPANARRRPAHPGQRSAAAGHLHPP